MTFSLFNCFIVYLCFCPSFSQE